MKLLIVEDEPLVQQRLQRFCREILGGRLESAFAAPTFDAAESTLAEHTVDLVLLDLNLAGRDGMDLLKASVAGSFHTIIVSANTDHEVVRRALDLGAAGFIPKTLPLGAIAEAIRTILAGEIWVPGDLQPPPDDEMARRLRELTPQQLRVLAMISQGLPNKQIAFALSVGEPTVKAHVTAILRKLGVTSRTQAVIAAKLIDLPPPP